MAFVGQEEQLRELQDRYRYLYTAIFIAFGILLSRLIYLQIFNGEKMRLFSEENRIRRVKIVAPRGMIVDRERKLLIDNRPSFDLEIIPQYLRESKRGPEVVGRLSNLIHMSVADIQSVLDKARGQPPFLPIKIKEDLPRDEVAAVESWRIDMPGVSVEMEIKRTNIFGDIAAHLLGYIGEVTQNELPKLNSGTSTLKYKQGDHIGKSGLEQRMEDVLRGVDGEEMVEVDALGRRKLDIKGNRLLGSKVVGKVEIPGKNLVLTIDQDLQVAAAKAFGDKAGALVAIDPSTGEILAMISRPAFDPTDFARGIKYDLWEKLRTDENRPLRDKTIQDHYSPGSTFKIVTGITGLEEGVIDENTSFNCPGYVWVGDRKMHCWKKEGHGNVSIVSALTQSCDVFFYRVAQKLKSVNDIAKWAFHLGLGQKTGINLAREVPGLVPTEEWKMKRYNIPWQNGETLSVAIGQGPVLATVLQLANMYSSIANGGTLHRPFLVKRIESFDGQVLESFSPEDIDTTRLSPKTYELVRQGLWGVVNAPNGTAHRTAELPGMDFVGKTGTVQLFNQSSDKIYDKCVNMKYHNRHHGVFTGFAPAANPVIAIAVLVEHACSGSQGAAPIAKEVVKAYLLKKFPELYGSKSDEKILSEIKSLPLRLDPKAEDEEVTIDPVTPSLRIPPPVQDTLSEPESQAPDSDGKNNTEE